MGKIILDLCGGSGNWSKPYKEDDGYIVISIDIKEHNLFENSGMSIQETMIGLLEISKENGMDVLQVHGVLAAPPCTKFTRAGRQWILDKNGEVDWQIVHEAFRVVKDCLEIIWITHPAWWALENPQGLLVNMLGKPVATFEPYQFGDPYSKKTLLWGNFNIPQPTNIVKPINSGTKESSMDYYWRKIKKVNFNKENRNYYRSITPEGFAKAFYESNP